MEVVGYVAPLLALIPVLFGGLVLYVVIRFGVKHGMRSYYVEAERGQSNGSV